MKLQISFRGHSLTAAINLAFAPCDADLLKQIEQEIAKNVAAGRGSLQSALQQKFGLKLK